MISILKLSQIWTHLYPHLAESRNLVIYDPTSSIVVANNFPLKSKDPSVTLSRPCHLEKLLEYSVVCPEKITCFPAPLDPLTGKVTSPQVRKEAMRQIENSLRMFISREFGNSNDVLHFSKCSDEILIDLSKLLSEENRTVKLSIDESVCPSVKWIGGEEVIPVREKLGAKILSQILGHLKSETGFQASAGIGSSVIVAKLAREFNKPWGITLVQSSHIDLIYSQINLRSAPELKGTKGRILSGEILIPGSSHQTLQTLFDLRKLIESFATPEEMHAKVFAKYPPELFGVSKCQRLWHLAKGTDYKEFFPNKVNKSISLKKSKSVIVQGTEVLGKSLEEIVSLGTYRLMELMKEPPKTINGILVIGKSDVRTRGCISTQIAIEDLAEYTVASVSSKISEKLKHDYLSFATPPSIEKLTIYGKY